MNRGAVFGLAALLTGLCAAAGADQKPPEIFTLPESTAQPAPLDSEGYTTWLVRFSEDPLPKFLNSLDGASSKRSRRPDTKGPAARSWLALLEGRQQSHLQVIGRHLARAPEVRRNYRAALNGVAVRLTPAEAQKIQRLPEVVSVARDSIIHVVTDLSPDWFGTAQLWNGAAVPSGVGGVREGVIGGAIDADTSKPRLSRVSGMRTI